MRWLDRPMDVIGWTIFAVPIRNGKRIGLVIFKHSGGWWWFFGRYTPSSAKGAP